MLLPLLVVTAMLIGGWTFARMISTWGRDSRSAQPSVFCNRQFSLWSLILFLFFPAVSAPSEPKNLTSAKQQKRASSGRKGYRKPLPLRATTSRA